MTNYCTIYSVIRAIEKLERNTTERFIGKLEAYEVDDKPISKFIELINKESKQYLKLAQAENPSLTHDNVRVRLSPETDQDGNDYAILTFYITDKLSQKEKRHMKKYVDDTKHHLKELLDG